MKEEIWKMKKKLLKILLGLMTIGVYIEIYWNNKKKIAQIENERNRFKNYFNLLSQWHRNSISKNGLDKILKENNINTIAIYGSGVLGRLIFKELETSDIEVVYFVDRNAENIVSDLVKAITVDEVKKEKKPDAIVVSLPYDFLHIKNYLECSLGEEYKVISIENLIYNI